MAESECDGIEPRGTQWQMTQCWKCLGRWTHQQGYDGDKEELLRGKRVMS
jgi:hypothetical protein